MTARIVSHEKIGFIKSHFILDNLITAWESNEWERETGQEALFLKIIFDKNYDRIEWNFILLMFCWLQFGSFLT